MSPCLGGIPPCTGFADGRSGESEPAVNGAVPEITLGALNAAHGDDLLLDWVFTAGAYNIHFILREYVSGDIIASSLEDVNRAQPFIYGRHLLVNGTKYMLHYQSRDSLGNASEWQTRVFTFDDSAGSSYIIDGLTYVVDGSEYIIE